MQNLVRLSFIAALFLLLLSFVLPFISIEFQPQVPKEIESAKDMVYLLRHVPGMNGFIESFFGPRLFSDVCQENWTLCFQHWLADQAGISTGAQYLLRMFWGAFERGEPLLGMVLLLFSVLFPFSKIALGIVITTGYQSIERRQSLFLWLYHTSKWSMTDVFVVALCVILIKAENLHLFFHAEWGLYCFLLSTILGSFATMRLGKELGFETSFPNLTSPNIDRQNPTE